jgi:EmrB/QacA subfamily drug resistance transporter
LTPVTAEQLSARYGTTYKWFATATVMVGIIASILSSTMINVALPDIMGEFGLGQDQIQWVSTAFLAATTSAMLAAAWAVASFGVCQAYVAALAIFAIGCVVGGFSPDDNGVILARAIQGAAAGLIQPLAMVVIFQAFPVERRGSAMGLYGLGVVLAPALGPTLGGVLIDNYSWRYIFFFGLPLCALGMLLAPLFLPTNSQSPRSPFDWLGFILMAVGVSAFLSGLSNGQRMGWDSTFVTGAFCMAAFAVVGFVMQERRSATPVLTLDVFLNPRFAAACVVAFMFGVGIFGSTYLVPLFVQTVQDYMATTAGLLLMPAGIVLGIVQPLAGRLSDHVSARLLISIGMALFAVSSVLMSNADTSTDFWTFAGWVVLGRIGMGFIMPSLNSGALKVLDHHQVGHGAGAVNFMRQLGGAVGVALLSVYLERQTTIYASEFNAMQTGTHAAADTLDLVAGLLTRAGLHDNVAVALRTQEAYRFLSRMIAAQASVMGFRASFLFVAVGFFLALIPTYFMRPTTRARLPRRGG